MGGSAMLVNLLPRANARGSLKSAAGFVLMDFQAASGKPRKGSLKNRFAR